jgi:hypothetical protein
MLMCAGPLGSRLFGSYPRRTRGTYVASPQRSTQKATLARICHSSENPLRKTLFELVKAPTKRFHFAALIGRRERLLRLRDFISEETH